MRLTGRPSITGRLTLLFVSASSAVLLALGLVIASSVEKHFEQQDMDVLNGKMELARHTLEQWRLPDELPRITQQLNNALVGHHGLEVIVLDPTRHAIFATPGANIPHKLAAASAANQSHRPFTWALEDHRYRAIAAEFPTGLADRSGMIVAVSLNIAHHQAFMSSFLQTLWLFVAGAAALTGFLGWAVARHGLAPLRAMREQAQVVTAQQLSHRLPVESVPVELAELAQSLNEMLARLEEAFHRLSDFSSDIAHELRTPLSNLMTETQVALSRQRSADDYRSILESNAEELEHMARMISDMLLLAKAENGLVVPNRETIDLAVEVQALFEYYDAVAEEKRLTLSLDGDAEVSADRLMLRRALGNLLSNAVRHSTENSTIHVEIRMNPKSVLLYMRNSGDSIPSEYRQRVFDRFFRVDPSRQRSSEGSGLGLAITKSIISAHGGTISVESMGDATTFTLSLPRASPFL